jgi:hypothetical protein
VDNLLVLRQFPQNYCQFYQFVRHVFRDLDAMYNSRDSISIPIRSEPQFVDKRINLWISARFGDRYFLDDDTQSWKRARAERRAKHASRER